MPKYHTPTPDGRLTIQITTTQTQFIPAFDRPDTRKGARPPGDSSAFGGSEHHNNHHGPHYLARFS
ncbi:hypothetical protein BDV93DRAFT_529129 [Ceratobasidium sp. AG-I]|nr:hypothetical protein BDV93DRAFT_529129 [Ceratobasidium sp. AG-I]